MTLKIELSPYAQLLGIEAQEIEGQLVFVLPYQAHNVGNDRINILHGGVIGGFLETVGISHLLHVRESADVPRTVDFSVDYLRPGKAETLYAECSVTKQGKRVANVHITAWQDSRQKPVAVARAHFLLSQASE